MPFRKAFILDLDQAEYEPCLALQRELQDLRIEDRIQDTLIFVEHPSTLTIGKSGGREHILVSPEWLQQHEFKIYEVERGGDVTYHGPGQLVGYPILDLNAYGRDVHRLVANLEEVLLRTLAAFGIVAQRREGYPGVWVGKRKIASLGLGVKSWVSSHGFALNVNTDLQQFQTITPCGLMGVRMTSMAEILGHSLAMAEVKEKIAEEICSLFRWEIARVTENVKQRTREHVPSAPCFDDQRPRWLSVPMPAAGSLEKMMAVLSHGSLHTVCEGAQCPNAGECFGSGTATFMILGDQCTRRCRFCAVDKGTPSLPEIGEAAALARTVQELGLKHVVVTSVTRDDLLDGGAQQFVRVVAAVRQRCLGTTIELLIPDFQGADQALNLVVAARPEVLGHNVETVPRLYTRVRYGADYERSLRLLGRVKEMEPTLITKSGLMVGLGEEPEEVLTVMDDLRQAGCDYLTVGQYLQPTEAHLPIESYISPAQFAWYREQALAKGFARAECGPLVRSSYHASV